MRYPYLLTPVMEAFRFAKREPRKAFVYLTSIAALALLGLALGGWVQIAVAAGIVAAAWALLRQARVGRTRANVEPHAPASLPLSSGSRKRPANSSDALVDEMLADGRYALLLRREIACSLSPANRERALEALSEGMALLPEGEVTLGTGEASGDFGDLNADQPGESHGVVVRVERVYLDRYPVTNAQYKTFVDAGGYEQMAIWDQEIWPAVLDFVDRTGCPGPRFWRDGCYLRGEEDHPVTGISWYEAAAYARWVGKRLPSDAEWVKAACWPVALSPTTRLQRRYPWGEAMDRRKAHLWGSGPNQPVSVYTYADGVTVGGCYQMIGNVWEWTASGFGALDPLAGQLSLPAPFKSVRGGAFDTYFDNQATCQFQSGENPISRKHNIGFRCAVCACDVAGPFAAGPGPEAVEVQVVAESAAEEVTA